MTQYLFVVKCCNWWRHNRCVMGNLFTWPNLWKVNSLCPLYTGTVDFVPPMCDHKTDQVAVYLTKEAKFFLGRSRVVYRTFRHRHGRHGRREVLCMFKSRTEVAEVVGCSQVVHTRQEGGTRIAVVAEWMPLVAPWEALLCKHCVSIRVVNPPPLYHRCASFCRSMPSTVATTVPPFGDDDSPWATMTVGILQNMVNPSLAPTQPEGSEFPTFSYGGEGIPRVPKQYRFSPHWYIFPIRWINQLNQSERLIYAPLAWITTDSGNGLVSSLCEAIAWIDFDL